MPKTFLLEIGTEEIPARFMEPALRQLRENAASMLASERLEYGVIEAYGTPRRLALLVTGLAERQADLKELKKGPAVKAAYDQDGNPTAAAKGFARSQGVQVSQLIIKNVDGTDYVFADRHVPGKPAAEILPSLCLRLVKSINFPKPMFWVSRDIRFARPVRWLVALYGGEVVPFEFAGLSAGNYTYGHRFLSGGAISLRDAGEYKKVLENNYVIVDQDQRISLISEQVRKAAESLGGRALLARDLLEEVNYLVEYPRAVTGSFDTEFLELPKEVLVTVMRVHQRYFPVFDQDDNLLPYFITVANGTRDEYLDNVRAGNERVIRARLADARFFFEEDRKKPLADYRQGLANIVFMEQVGTMLEKTGRIRDLVEKLGGLLNIEDNARRAAARAAELCKADLVTQMVYEFPELQGIMGRHYALLSGESEAVAQAIDEHYAPRHAADAPASSAAGALVAVADKMDTLAACFGLGLIPSGSQDPYALRRSAQGVVNTLAAHGFTCSLKELAALAQEGLAGKTPREGDVVIAELHEFLRQRVRYLLTEKGYRYDIIDAVLGSTADDLPGIVARAEVLQERLGTPELENVLVPFTRAANLTREFAAASVNPGLLESPAEKKLYDALQGHGTKAVALAEKGDFAGAFAELASLQEQIDEFFTEVMVMVEDPAIRQNRLSLLAGVRDAFLVLGDLSKIVQPKNK